MAHKQKVFKCEHRDGHFVCLTLFYYYQFERFQWCQDCYQAFLDRKARERQESIDNANQWLRNHAGFGSLVFQYKT